MPLSHRSSPLLAGFTHCPCQTFLQLGDWRQCSLYKVPRALLTLLAKCSGDSYVSSSTWTLLYLSRSRQWKTLSLQWDMKKHADSSAVAGHQLKQFLTPPQAEEESFVMRETALNRQLAESTFIRRSIRTRSTCDSTRSACRVESEMKMRFGCEHWQSTLAEWKQKGARWQRSRFVETVHQPGVNLMRHLRTVQLNVFQNISQWEGNGFAGSASFRARRLCRP